jgi:YD repeat-containing protein
MSGDSDSDGDPQGTIRSTTYDARGRVVCTRDVRGPVSYTYYDGAGGIISARDTSPDRLDSDDWVSDEPDEPFITGG